MLKTLLAPAAVLLIDAHASAAEPGVLTYHNNNTRHGLYTVPDLIQAAAAGITLERAGRTFLRACADWRQPTYRSLRLATEISDVTLLISALNQR